MEDDQAVFQLALTFPSPTSIDQTTFSETWNEKFRDDHSYVGIAEETRGVVGYVAGYMHSPFYANGPTFWVDEILIAETLRSRGIGKLLMQSVSQWAGSRGCKQVLLASSGAGDFYQSLGYKATAQYFKKYI